ncbi:hypothetical protein AB0I10_18620 [Streptomyces sp. NPDC050636]|uniref:hypothetical protein n=1 Tax=Streptomyces sp. NPDC050636 TaxID=3154510 RepID=UPI0034172810
MEVEIVDSILAAYSGGALLKLFVDAPALEAAEDAVRGVVGEFLKQSELLGEWKITKCEVELHPELAQQSLDAADGPDAPPADPAARAAQHAQARAEATAVRLTDEEVEAMRAKISALAPRLTAFGLGSFGWCEDDESGIGRDHAELAAGALVYAIDLLVDQLFDDVEALGEGGGTVEECDGPLWLLEDLPDRLAAQYTALFARRFLVTAVSLTGRLTREDFVQLSCVAEEFLLRFLLREAEVVLDAYGLLTDEITSAWEVFADEAYQDSDDEWLYEGATDDTDEGADGAQPEAGVLDIERWFTPFDKTGYVHPYAATEAAEPGNAV